MPTPMPKGKGKANERTPLLDATGRSNENASGDGLRHGVEEHQVSTSPHLSVWRAWKSYLLTAAVAFLTLLFGLILTIILLANSYAAPAWHNVSKALSHSGQGGDMFWKEALLIRGPDSVSVTGVGRIPDESGAMRLVVNMTIALRIAVDTDFVMSFRDDGAHDDTWWRDKWKALGRWSVRQLGRTTATVGDVVIYPSSLSQSDALVTFKPVAPIAIPLHPGLSKEDHRNPPLSLESVSVPLTVYPSQNASMVLKFLKQSWAQGFMGVRIHGSSLTVHGGNGYNHIPKWWELNLWRNWLKFDKDDLALILTLPVPPFRIPSHPPYYPGSDLPELSELLVLESFNISSASSLSYPARHDFSPTRQTDVDAGVSTFGVEQGVPTRQTISKPSKEESSLLHYLHVPSDRSVLISARASLPHPFASLAPALDLGDGFPLPFIVSLPVPPPGDHATNVMEHVRDEPIPVANVYALPEFNTTHIRIPLWGSVLPFSNSSAHLPDAISAFVSSYLSYKSSPISIYSPLYPSMEVQALFPPPSHRLELLRDVSIENMDIHPGMGAISLSKPAWETSSASVVEDIWAMEILASATVHARVVLPQGMDLDMRVVRIWVDCLVYDGKVPPQATTLHLKRDHILSDPPPSRVVKTPAKSKDPPLPAPLPLPTPLPLRAFGRITPKAWLNATSISVPPLQSDVGRNSQGGATGEENTGTNVLVTAQLVDVPLEVLPGRQGDLSRFVTKVLFSKEPVMAGIRGVAAVGVSIPGLTTPASWGPRVEGNELILTGLPFEGNVRVGGRDFDSL